MRFEDWLWQASANATGAPWSIAGRGYTAFGADGVAVVEGYDGYDDVEDEEQTCAERRAKTNVALIVALRNAAPMLVDLVGTARDHAVDSIPEAIAALDALISEIEP